MKKLIGLTVSILMLLAISVYAGDVLVQWDDNPASENVTVYTVYFYETAVPGVVYHQNTSISEISLSEDLFKFDTDYSFYVTASNSAGESIPSNTVNAIVRTSHIPPGDVNPDPIIVNTPSTITITIIVK